jgi:hypothetical protein
VSTICDAVRRRYFNRVTRDGTVYYLPKKAHEVPAWRESGVCPSCNRWSITVGRCVMCGWRPDGVWK